MSNAMQQLARLIRDNLESQTGIRMDSSGVQNLQRALVEQSETIYADYAPLKSEILAPLNTDTAEWAEEISHPILSDVGQARVVANDADDLPTIGIELDDNLSPILTVGCRFVVGYLEARAPLGVNKIGEKRRAAIDAVRRAVDQICMIGYPTANLGGFLNNPSVPVFTLPTGNWLTATNDQIIADLAAWEAFSIDNSGEGGTSGELYPNTLALPSQEFSVLVTRNAGSGTDSSIWTLFTQHSSQGKLEGKVMEWSLVRSQYAENVVGTRRGTMYCRDPRVLKAENPLPFEELRPQERNLAASTPVVGRTGGVIFMKPGMASYAAVG